MKITTIGWLRSRMKEGRRAVLCAMVLTAFGGASLSACRPVEPASSVQTEASSSDDHSASVELTSEQVERIGIATTPAAATTFTPEAVGYGVVLGHDVIAQAVAEVATAEAALRQSRAALARIKGLADTPGAFSSEIYETAARQASADEAELTLARRKLSATWGGRSPWGEDESSALLRDVASGDVKLVRATFPLGELSNAEPQTLRLTRLEHDARASWQSDAVWSAPADAAIPGRSLFALLRDSDASEGERLEVRASVGAAVAGVVIPTAAVVISDGRYWCYVERAPRRFVREAIDASRPTEGGYFVAQGVRAGDPIATAGAGWLLARETNPSMEGD